MARLIKAGDEEGVPGREAGLTGGVQAALPGKSRDQRMPLGRCHRPNRSQTASVNLSPIQPVVGRATKPGR